MQVNNNYQPSFGKVFYHPELQASIKQGAFAREAVEQLEAFKTKYDKSPVTVILGLMKPQQATRLDAQVFYREPGSKKMEDKGFKYLAETLIGYFLNFTPKKFLSKVGKELEKISKLHCKE